MLHYLLFILGFILLIKGAGLLVDGASSIAKKWGVSSLVIGLTVVSFGTSAPELAINLLAAASGSSDIAIGNVIGSNLANILLILGVASVIFPLTVKKGTTWKEIPLSFLAIIAVGLLANDYLIDNGQLSHLTRIDGLILILFFSIFLYYTFGISKVEGKKDGDIEKRKNYISIFMIVLGVAGLFFGGRFLVNGALYIAQNLGISESLIALTIIAIGTSLPELATSAMAAYKKNADIAIGNVIGSNIFNLFLVLGLASIVKPLNFSSALNFDISFLGFATLLLFGFMFMGKKHLLKRWQGIIFILLYVFYIIYLGWRG